jgi:hypothetical protein
VTPIHLRRSIELHWIFDKTQKEGDKGEDGEHIVGWGKHLLVQTRHGWTSMYWETMYSKTGPIFNCVYLKKQSVGIRDPSQSVIIYVRISVPHLA